MGRGAGKLEVPSACSLVSPDDLTTSLEDLIGLESNLYDVLSDGAMLLCVVAVDTLAAVEPGEFDRCCADRSFSALDTAGSGDMSDGV